MGPGPRAIDTQDPVLLAAVLVEVARHRPLLPPARCSSLNGIANSLSLRRRHPKPPTAINLHENGGDGAPACEESDAPAATLPSIRYRCPLWGVPPPQGTCGV